MTDTNRPTKFRVIDSWNNSTVFECDTMAKAMAFCEEKEPSEKEESDIGVVYRYHIRPMRNADD